MNRVPVIDLELYRSNNPQEQKSFSQSLGQAFENYGFAIVSNHGIPQELIDRFYTLSKEFFKEPDVVKEKYEIPGYNGQRGYTSFGKEHAKQSNVGDLKEFFQVGQPDPPAGADETHFMPNVQVAEVPDFTDKAIELYQTFENTGRDLLRAIAEYLGLERNYFDDKIKGGNSILRSIYYPPITAEPKSAIRSESHEDINLITLLVGASAGGLQLLDGEGKWVEVLPDSNQIAINVGDMLQRLTNRKLISTTHRVINPPKEQWHEDRLSIPFFLHPLPEVKLDALPSTVPVGTSPIWPPITSGEYLEERLKEIGLKK